MPSTFPLTAACVLAVAFLANPAQAQGAAPGAAASPLATCDGVHQDKAACQREAGAARQEAARNGLTSGSAATLDANALARCKLQPAADQADCEARIEGTSSTGGQTTRSGSVIDGGVLRETVTPVPAPAK